MNTAQKVLIIVRLVACLAMLAGSIYLLVTARSVLNDLRAAHRDMEDINCMMEARQRR